MIQGVIICFIYVLILLIFNKISGVKYTELIKNESNIKKGVVIPIGIATILLTAYSFIKDYSPGVFSYSPKFSSIFLWVVPIVIVAGMIIRFKNSRWDKFSKKAILYVVLGAFIVGFSEELLVRGILVDLLQSSGYSVVSVGLISSAIFGAMHGMNYFGGQDLKTTGGQMITTTLIGMNFYVVLVLTGSLWFPIVLHALHDLSIFALGGEINKREEGISKLEALATFSMLALAPISIFILWIN